MTKEQAQEVVNEFLAGEVWLSQEFEVNHDFELSIYEVKQEIEDKTYMYLTFPAKLHYKEALERYNENPNEENFLKLQEIIEGDFEDFYDYDNPVTIEWESCSFEIVDGKVI